MGDVWVRVVGGRRTHRNSWCPQDGQYISMWLTVSFFEYGWMGDFGWFAGGDGLECRERSKWILADSYWWPDVR